MYSGGLPLAPFPAVESCLGLLPKDSSIELKDGYVILAFDYHVDTAQTDCIFDLSNLKGAKELRMMSLLRNAKNRKNNNFGDRYKSTMKSIEEDIKKNWGKDGNF